MHASDFALSPLNSVLLPSLRLFEQLHRVAVLEALKRFHDLAEGIHSIPLNLDADIGSLTGNDNAAPFEDGVEHRRDVDVEVLGNQVEHLPLLAYLGKAELGGGVAQERDVNQPLDGSGRFSKPVDQLVDQIQPVLFRCDRSDLPVDVDPLRKVFDVVLGNVRLQLNIDQTLGGRSDLGRLSPLFRDRFG